MKLSQFIGSIGPEVQDAEEESFLKFSQDIPSSNLGFVDSRSDSIDISIHDQEFTIHQSPAVLNSKRPGGTTGAVLWKITPVVAEWISSTDNNVLWTSSILNSESTVVELGCGISGLLALSLAPFIGHYIATDQPYVQKLIKENLTANSRRKDTRRPPIGHRHRPQGQRSSSRKAIVSPTRSRNYVDNASSFATHESENITFSPLDWETDDPKSLKDLIPPPPPPNNNKTSSSLSLSTTVDGSAPEADEGFDFLLACDCVYNESLIPPFVRTCADICRLRPAYSAKSHNSSDDDDDDDDDDDERRKPTVCIIAQQLRSHEVFEEWMRVALADFRVWRISDEVVGKELGSGSGYVVHVLLLRG